MSISGSNENDSSATTQQTQLEQTHEGPAFKITKLDPKEVAKNLKLQHMEMMMRISSDEFDTSIHKLNGPNLNEMMAIQDQMNTAVVNDIILSQSLDEQKQVFNFYVNLMDECLKNDNLYAGLAIYSALESDSSISAFKYLRGDEDIENKMKYANNLFSMANSQKNLREHEAQIKGASVPTLSNIVNDVTFANDGNLISEESLNSKFLREVGNNKSLDQKSIKKELKEMIKKEEENLQKELAGLKRFYGEDPNNKDIKEKEEQLKIINDLLKQPKTKESEVSLIDRIDKIENNKLRDKLNAGKNEVLNQAVQVKLKSIEEKKDEKLSEDELKLKQSLQRKEEGKKTIGKVTDVGKELVKDIVAKRFEEPKQRAAQEMNNQQQNFASLPWPPKVEKLHEKVRDQRVREILPDANQPPFQRQLSSIPDIMKKDEKLKKPKNHLASITDELKTNPSQENMDRLLNESENDFARYQNDEDTKDVFISWSERLVSEMQSIVDKNNKDKKTNQNTQQQEAKETPKIDEPKKETKGTSNNFIPDSVVSSISSAVNAVETKAVNTVNSIVDTVKDSSISSAVNAVETKAVNTVNSIVNTVNSTVNSVNRTINKPGIKVANTVDSVVKATTDFYKGNGVNELKKPSVKEGLEGAALDILVKRQNAEKAKSEAKTRTTQGSPLPPLTPEVKKSPSFAKTLRSAITANVSSVKPPSVDSVSKSFNSVKDTATGAAASVLNAAEMAQKETKGFFESIRNKASEKLNPPDSSDKKSFKSK